ncbi:hypothetical protein LENED_000975 [Lentinula edodes]|uniref:Uncharacterized protein n=1 Tax=Lentinula edodes TaxID=5353 RepID=A0A1Q3DX65_LENED|nr:hypothetical protein LENED_000975 [Lentinula edodes]
MNLLQRIIQLFRKLYNSQPAQLALRSVLALYTFLVRQGRKRTLKKRKLSARPDFDEKNVASEPPPSSIPAISATICASRTPAKDTLYPYPFSGTNASVSSQDVSASSVHTDVNTQRSYRRSLGISHPHQTRHLDPRSRSNPHIDIPAISGQHAHLISMVNYLITIDRGPDEAGFDTVPMQTSPIQEEVPFTISETSELKRLSEVHERFHPIPPENHPRYERSIYVPDESATYILEPMTTSFELGKAIPMGWEKMIHPEGACYYVYQNGRYYTDANIMDSLTKDRIMVCISDFDDFIRSRGIQLSSRANTVLNLRIDEGKTDKYTCEYYIANHATRSVFWLDTVDADSFSVWWEVKGVTSSTHIEHAVASLYWYHCHLYPHSYNLSVEAVDELRDILLHCIGDTITSSTSTVPYNISDLKDMMLLLNNIRKNPATGGGVSAYSRIMYIFNLYYGILSNLWVDGLVHEAAWADFVGKMNEEWQQLILFNTVLLNANVAFLAIQSIDNSSDSPGRSPAQIASFLSIVASFGSIILGLVLARKHRAKAKDTAEDAAKFLNSWERNRLGVASLAILYSVPYALLLWGVLCFLVAFSFMCYSNSDALVLSIMSSSWFVVAILVFWCVTALASWDRRSNDQPSFWSYVHELLSYLLFGLWWLIDGAVIMAKQGWQFLHTRPTAVQEAEQRPIELQNVRKGSMGTVVELWRKSSLFSGTDRKNTSDTQATAVEV